MNDRLDFKKFSDFWFQELTALYYVCQKSRRVLALLCFCVQTLSQHAKIVTFEMASKVLEGRRNIFGRSKVFGKSYEMFGSRWNVYGNCGNNKTKTVLRI